MRVRVGAHLGSQSSGSATATAEAGAEAEAQYRHRVVEAGQRERAGRREVVVPRRHPAAEAGRLPCPARAEQPLQLPAQAGWQSSG